LAHSAKLSITTAIKLRQEQIFSGVAATAPAQAAVPDQ